MTGSDDHAPIRAVDASRVLPGTVPVTLVEDVDVSIHAGDFVAITGPSGSGKSSLLYLLGLLDRPTSGKVFLYGNDTTELSSEELAELRLERIGFVFQFHFLLPEFTAMENVLIPMRRLGALTSAEQRSRAAEVLTSLDLAEHLDKWPDQLSGGQRQRVAVARALANDPPIILADEPTGNLDSKSGRAVFDIFSDLALRQGRTVVVVTHDIGLAGMTSRRLHIVDGRITSDEHREAGAAMETTP